VVDSFEQYTDDVDASQAIFQTWIDGWSNESGSQVGYTEAPFTEQTSVNGGRKSMPLAYDNADSPYYSEVSRTWETVQSWTDYGADTLRLFFKGEADNTLDSLYLRVEDSAGHAATVTHPDPDAVLTTEWTSWVVPFTEFSAADVDLENVKTLHLGIGDRDNPTPTGSGMVYIDDIEIGCPLSAE
jgi:hypothetical protein